MQEEICQLKELLTRDEEKLSDETSRCREARQQAVRLNEMVMLLQQQIDTGGAHMAAQKQVGSSPVLCL